MEEIFKGFEGDAPFDHEGEEHERWYFIQFPAWYLWICISENITESLNKTIQ